MIDCPANGCQKESPNRSGLGQHWNFAHEGTPPWKQQTCDYCGVDFVKNESLTTEGNTFCDSDCYGSYKSENTVGEELPWYEAATKIFTCDNCGSEFESLQSQRNVENTENVFCDHECYGKFERTENDRQYYGPKWSKQRAIALEKSEGVCVYDGCGREKSRTGRELDLHHIVSLSEFDSFAEANRPSNLVPVCAEHHGKIENKPTEHFDQ